jgi:TonB family protein
MTSDPHPPLRFGEYLLTAELGRDALGRVYRALRLSGERGFARVRILESPEISEDSVLDAIEENGEIHSFLKNPTIARGVQMDSVGGTPFIAWDEPSGRTLDLLLTKSRRLGRRIPFEHALLIAEKVSTALDHAYSTKLDEERTLHGLVWPGFVSISDEGETRLVGFGLAPGLFSSLSKPRFAREIAPYLAPEERSGRRVGTNSDVYSAGVLLFELLTGRLPSPDPIAELRGARTSHPIPPGVAALLTKCLGPAESRYPSSGDLRRELGKLLFSGAQSPTTFNLAFFLSSLFASEIEAEKEARARELLIDPASARPMPLPTIGPGPAEVSQSLPLSRPPAVSWVGNEEKRLPVSAVGGVVLLAAAILGTLYLLVRRPSPLTQSIGLVSTPASEISHLAPTPGPAPASPPTTGMSEAEFQKEVSRRVGEELKAFEREMTQTPAASSDEPRAAVEPTQPPASRGGAASGAAAGASQSESTPQAAPRPSEPEISQPTPPAAERVDSAASPIETPPRILRIIKPPYPLIALKAHIGGIVILRVLVSETGAPIDIEILKGVRGGITEAAVGAVRGWTFEPARRDGVAVQAWMTIPIPFQP